MTFKQFEANILKRIETLETRLYVPPQGRGGYVGEDNDRFELKILKNLIRLNDKT